MFDVDFSGGNILHVLKQGFTRPGEVPREMGAMAQIKAGMSKSGPKRDLVDPLDSPMAMEQHRRLIATYKYELDRHAANRVEMATDEDFYDHIQWTTEELAEFDRRGQYPLVFNLIQTTINWMLGTQRRAPQDYKILPRSAEGLIAAERKTELMRHVRDENMSNDEVAMAFADAVKAGIGWMETGEGDGTEGVLVFDRRESWRNIIFDSRHTRYDMTDARFIFRTKWLDLDLCAAMWPERLELLEQSKEGAILAARFSDLGDDAMDMIEDEVGFSSMSVAGGAYSRDRLRVIEAWFKKPAIVPVMQGGDFRGELFDEWSEGHWDELVNDRATLVMRPRETMHVALMTEKGMLDLRQSPYRHNQFPFTPIWGYRRARDGMPYGAIRGLRGPQQDLNKRASKALHHLSTSRLFVMEGSVKDPEVTRDEANRPDAMIVYKQGYDRPQIDVTTDVAAAHIQLMEKDAQMIQSVGGVTDENLGRRSNATSGKAIMARQDQGSLATSVFFDNLRRSSILHGVKQIINIEQFYTAADKLRVTDSRGKADWLKVNDPEEPQTAVHMFKADFVLEEEDWRASTRQAQAEQLVELLQQMAATNPQIVMAILDLVVEALDVPKRDEIVKRIRSVTGQADPDEDPKNPSQETQDRMAAQQAQQAMQERAAKAEIEGIELKNEKLRADATAVRLGLRGASLKQVSDAIAAAVQVAGAPAVAAAVDQLMLTAQEDASAAIADGNPQEVDPMQAELQQMAEEQPQPDDMAQADPAMIPPPPAEM